MRRRTRDLAPDGLPDDALATLDARMLWSALAEPGDGVAGALIDENGPLRALEIALGSNAPTAIGPQELHAGRRRWASRHDEAPEASAAGRRCGVQPVTPEHRDWPRRVDDLGVHAPVCLWVRGDSRALGTAPRGLALVGARAATSYGEHVVGELSAGLASVGVAIVSCAAYGMDGVAHQAALITGGVTTAGPRGLAHFRSSFLVSRPNASMSSPDLLGLMARTSPGSNIISNGPTAPESRSTMMVPLLFRLGRRGRGIDAWIDWSTDEAEDESDRAIEGAL